MKLQTRVRIIAMASLLLPIGSVAAQSTGQSTGGVDAPRILIIHSHDAEYRWTADMNEVLHRRLAAAYPDVRLFVEYLDAKRHDTEAIRPPFEALIEAKYGRADLDLVAVTDNPAFELVLERRADLFAGTPIVFAGVNDFDAGDLEGIPGVTGVAEQADFRGTVELATRLHPQAEYLATISDSTVTGRINQAEFDRMADSIGSGLKVIRLADLSRAELGRRLRDLPENGIVVNLSLFRTADGTVFSDNEGNRFIVEHTANPVYTAWDVGIGTGVVGGLVVSARGQAEAQSDLILEILGGASPQNLLAVTDSPNRYIFDYATLADHGIRSGRLPAGSILMNEPETMWYEYRVPLLAIAASFGVLAAFSTFLLINIVRRRRAERKYRTVFESLQDVYAEVRRSDGRITTISPSVRRFGYEPADVIGAPLSVLRLDPEALRDLGDRLQQERSVDDYELGLQTADGTPVTASISARLEGRDSGEQLIVGTIRDVSERKRIEEELRRLHKAVEEAGHDVFITDATGTIAYVNPAFERTTGYTRDEAIGRNPRFLKSGEMSADYYRRLWKTIRRGDTWHEQIINRRKDGSLYYASQTVAPVFGEHGGIDWYVAVQNDETARIESERQYRLLAENATDMISRHDSTGAYIYVSPACRDLLGYEPEELVGVNAYTLFHPEDIERIAEAHDFIRRGPEITYITYRIRRRDGSYTWFETTSKTVWDRDSESVAEIISVSRDVSERIRIEQRLTEAKAQAEAASQAKSEFLANISHEIRTPLHAIMGFAELLQRRTTDRSALKDIRTIEESAETLLRLISDILDLSKVEAGRLDLAPSFEDPSGMVTAVAAMFEPQAREKGVQLETDVGDEVPSYLYVDGVRLRQIVVNLVGNALKFTDSGSVTLSLSGTERDEGVFDLLLSVVDTGIGISETTREHMFEAFSQGRGDTSRTHGGTGLGLAITRRLVDRMGGHIDVETREGAGSRFLVTIPGLPLSHESAGPADIPAGTAHSPAGPASAPGANEATPGEPEPNLDSLPRRTRERLRTEMAGRIRAEWHSTHEVKMRDDILRFGEHVASIGTELGVAVLARHGHDLVAAAREFDVDGVERGFDQLRDLAASLEVDLDVHPQHGDTTE